MTLTQEMKSLSMHGADDLLSLTSPPPATADTASGRRCSRGVKAREGVFECKTCSKRFPTFQALGGHRTSHTRLQARLQKPGHGDEAAAAARDKAVRVHECAVCGLEFSMGQALGGHMRRHKGKLVVAAGVVVHQPEMLDLNYPPVEECSEPPRLLNLLV